MKKTLSILILMFVTAALFAQSTVTVQPYGLSPRQAEEDTTDIFDVAYSSLLNVGKETTMYLMATIDSGDVASGTWEVTSSPSNSTAAIGEKVTDGNSQTVVFKTDKSGTYVISFTAGGVTGSVTINAGTYKGAADNCALCHNDMYQKWQGTGHSDILVRGLNGTLSSHYGESCLSCHTTGYDANASNDGFDDRPFTFPDSLYDGQYDNMVSEYPYAMQLANIQCESCHGPGSNHMGNIDDNKIEMSLDANVCAICHDEGTHHGFPAQWRASGEDATEFDGRGFHGGHAVGAFVGYAGGRAGCAACHSGAGYVQWVKEGRPVDDLGLPASIATLPDPTNISCAVCHDPHDNSKDNHQLRQEDTQLGDGTPVTFEKYGFGAQCMECHRSRRYAAEYASDPNNGSAHFGPHHGPQADMLIGTNYPDYGLKNPLPSSPHAIAGGNACVDCHMAGDLLNEEGEISHLGGHSFNMNDAEGNDHVEACEPCHGDVGETFKEKIAYLNGSGDHDGDGVVEGLQEEVHGLLEELATYLPQTDGAVDMSAKDNPVEVVKGGYAYMWVEEDRSFGIHNPAFTVALLQTAINSLKYGAAMAGEIQAVSDIPNDQGYQVRVVWTPFDADNNTTADAIENYTILRKVEDAGMPKGVASYNGISEISANISEGSRFRLMDEYWDVVKEVSAYQEEIAYSAVVPTLYNNSAEGDTAWTTFKVLGKTSSGIVAETAAMAGYSTDDLAPVVPAGFAGAFVDGSIDLMWEAPVDEDFNYFALYKGTESGFDPSASDPIAVTSALSFSDADVEDGKTYFYTIAAVDFAGNVSPYAAQLSFVVTDVIDGSGIPTEFSLSQNYPNPFNPTTEIRFGVPEQSNVKITIYNTVGKQVAVLVNKSFGAGYYTYTFDASNLATGVYFYEMQTNSFRQTYKMLLIK